MKLQSQKYNRMYGLKETDFYNCVNWRIVNSIIGVIILYYSYISLYTIKNLNYKGFGNAFDEYECNLTFTLVMIYSMIFSMVGFVVSNEYYYINPNNIRQLFCNLFSLMILMIYGLLFMEMTTNSCENKEYNNYKKTIYNVVWMWINMIFSGICIMINIVFIYIIYKLYKQTKN